MGLTEYAQQHPPHQGGSGCWTCTTLPDDVLAEINAALRGELGVPTNVRVLVDYLRSEGYEVTPAKIHYHKGRRHHVSE